MKPLLLVICGVFLSEGRVAAQTLQVVPARVMADETAAIRAGGLEPNERVTMRAELTDGGGQHWASQADFLADAQGTVDTSRQTPVAGSYKEVSAMGLVWSMMPVGKKVGAYMAIRDLGPQPVEFHLLRHDKGIPNAQLEQAMLADGVQRLPVHEDGLRGPLFVPPGTGRHPGILVVGG